jgi:hypothetical protein
MAGEVLDPFLVLKRDGRFFGGFDDRGEEMFADHPAKAMQFADEHAICRWLDSLLVRRRDQIIGSGYKVVLIMPSPIPEEG